MNTVAALFRSTVLQTANPLPPVAMPTTSANVHEHTCTSPDALATALATTIATQLAQAIAQRGQALLAVSGGKSPIALFQQLAQTPLDWARVTVLLVDERCVPHTPPHPDSNTALVRQHLLQHHAAAARFVTFFDELPADLSAPNGNGNGIGNDSAHAAATTPATASATPTPAQVQALAEQANQRMASLPWPLDVAVLGMGEDGHTASLFPAAPGLAHALISTQPVAAVRPDTTGQAPHPRLTLTLPTLCATRLLHLPLAGATKLAVYRQALVAANTALPVSLVLHGSASPVNVWLA